MHCSYSLYLLVSAKNPQARNRWGNKLKAFVKLVDIAKFLSKNVATVYSHQPHMNMAVSYIPTRTIIFANAKGKDFKGILRCSNLHFLL